MKFIKPNGVQINFRPNELEEISNVIDLIDETITYMEDEGYEVAHSLGDSMTSNELIELKNKLEIFYDLQNLTT